jgi:hypothetical protein
MGKFCNGVDNSKDFNFLNVLFDNLKVQGGKKNLLEDSSRSPIGKRFRIVFLIGGYKQLILYKFKIIISILIHYL